MSTLDAVLQQSVRGLCAEAYGFYDKGEFRQALRKFYQAWNLLPKPQTDYPEAGWVLTAIGDAYFCSQQFDQGKEALTSALFCENMIDNPFIHLRLGQCLLELGIKATACTHLGIAYDRAGHQLFEKEAPKYLMAALQPEHV